MAEQKIKTNQDLVVEILERIEHIQNHLNALEGVVYYVQGRKYGRADVDPGNIRQHLFELELNEWRNLFMFAITLPDGERKRIKAAAYDRFLRDGMHVANYFSGGDSPSSWLAADEEEFRAMVKQKFLKEN